MRILIRIILIAFYLLCMLLIATSTVDKYDIIYEMDPTIPRGSLIDHEREDGHAAAGLFLLMILSAQIAFFYFEPSRKWKWIAAIMALLAVLFYFIRINA